MNLILASVAMAAVSFCIPSRGPTSTILSIANPLPESTSVDHPLPSGKTYHIIGATLRKALYTAFHIRGVPSACIDNKADLCGTR